MQALYIWFCIVWALLAFFIHFILQHFHFFICQGFKVAKPSLWRSTLSWQAVSATRNQAASRFMGNQQNLGLQFAQLSRDASAAVSGLYMFLQWSVSVSMCRHFILLQDSDHHHLNSFRVLLVV